MGSLFDCATRRAKVLRSRKCRVGAIRMTIFVGLFETKLNAARTSGL